MFHIIRVDKEMLQRESLVKGQSVLTIMKLDLTSVDVTDLGNPRIMIDELPRTSRLYTINRVKLYDEDCEDEEVPFRAYTKQYKSLMQITIENDAFVFCMSADEHNGTPF